MSAIFHLVTQIDGLKPVIKLDINLFVLKSGDGNKLLIIIFPYLNVTENAMKSTSKTLVR